jgi:hypothetical protein
VGFGLGFAGGGGRSLIVCALANPTTQKRASTAKSSAGLTCFPATRIIKPLLMPPGLLALVCLVNKFSDGMIHGVSAG